MDLSTVLDNREAATLSWLAVLVLFALWHTHLRTAVKKVIQTLLKPAILLALVLMLLYIGMEVWLGSILSLWDPSLTKATVIWTVASGVVLLFGMADRQDSERFFGEALRGLIAVTVVLEFFLNLFVFSFWLELLLLPVLAVVAILGTVAGMKEETLPSKRLADGVLAAVGLGLFAYVVYQIFTGWRTLDTSQTLREFALPIWLTIGFLPFLHGLNLYLAYDSAFSAVDWAARTKKARWYARLALLVEFHIRANELRRLPWIKASRLADAESVRAARRMITSYRQERRRKEEAKARQQERLLRYAASQETDERGRRLDRREFKATMDALRWVAACQRGWYQGRGGRYRRRIEQMVNTALPVQGLPDDPAISVEVAKGGQAWCAWRRTVSGWCFAIGGIGPPGLEWHYDGPEPPNGFPGEDPAWGEQPLDDAGSPNWD